MATPFPNIVPDQATSLNVNPDIIRTRKGHGYSHRMPNGINYRRENWRIQYGTLTQSEFNTMTSFLQAIDNGSVTTWTPPTGGGEKKYVLAEGGWEVGFPSGIHYSISFTLEEVFDPA